ncbi:MAG: AAA family ATPase [Gammaproteobacteria bacterium]|jgi:AAA+ ATPase superfamily predicted ATPase|nr:AAA family ATPase [Gammaproteobacteria bacterium]
MALTLIGREEEQKSLQEFYDSNRPEFMAIYGRRRVGKTFLIKQYFEKKKCFFFSITGIQNGKMPEQINRFVIEIGRIFYKGTQLKEQTNWYDTFDLLMDAINKFVSKKQKVVLFFDEFPWMATHRSKLLSVLEYFWNQYWSTDTRIKLVICGSSASWILKKIINNKGGLHNRITRKIQLQPFNLAETKLFLSLNGVKLNNNHVTHLYMVTGGIPYYLAHAKKGLSAPQLIENLAFTQNSLLFKEFDNLFSSLFDDAEPYVEILRIIAAHRYGVGQEDIIKKAKLISRGGRASDKLKDLEEAGFIISFTPYMHKKRGIYYRVMDEYTLFYLKWIEPLRKTLQKESLEKGYWEKIQESGTWYNWAGYTFESICYKHIAQIRKKLEISPSAIANTWRYTSQAKSEEDGTQIDLLFDRRDNTITICEIKYTLKPFVIDKKYAKILENKHKVFVEKTKTNKQIFITMIASSGIKDNSYVNEHISGVVTLDDLF